MALVDMNWNPPEKQLRQFGWIALIALPVLGGFWSGGNATVIAVTASLGALAAGIGWLQPRWLKPVFLGLSLLFLPIGIVVSEAALLLIYFGLFTPMGLFFRLIGRDRLERQLDRQAKSYWKPKRQPNGPASYLKQW